MEYGSLGAYPPGTHAGDPSAPWNEDDGGPCEDCRHYAAIGGEHEDEGVCLFRAEDYRELREQVWRCVVGHRDSCSDWEER